MFVELTNTLPKHCYVALSGGPDSVMAAHWLGNGGVNRVVGVIHVHHNTGEFADRACEFVNKNYMGVINFKITDPIPEGASKEEFWREQRYKFFSQVTDYPIVTAHNLNDCVEEYLINKLIRFSPKDTISYNGPSNVIRPFRTTSRKAILDYCRVNNLQYLMDPSNLFTKYLRNKIRHDVIPNLLEVNPGIFTQVKKLILKDKNPS